MHTRWHFSGTRTKERALQTDRVRAGLGFASTLSGAAVHRR